MLYSMPNSDKCGQMRTNTDKCGQMRTVYQKKVVPLHRVSKDLRQNPARVRGQLSFHVTLKVWQPAKWYAS